MSVTLSPTAPRTATVPALTVLALGLLALGAVFWPECRAAVRVWLESTAYGHCFLVAPISAYLAWERRDRLRGLLPRPTARFAVLGLPLAAGWFVAERLGIMEGRQLMALGFVELMFLCVLGWPLFRALLAPLAYLVFLVPFGAFVTPALQTFTAHFIGAGLTLFGIPHFANDMIIEIAAGTFFVAEACAGLRFLIAAVAFGVFYALLNFRSPARRLGFIAISLVVPVLANGVRALGIVLLGHVLGSAEAGAADHVIYGWVFFSFVMLLLVAAGLPLRETPAAIEQSSPPAPAGVRGVLQPWPAVFVVLVACLAPGVAMAFDRLVVPPVLAGPPRVVAPAGCTLQPTAQETGVARFALACGERNWAVSLVGVAARSTGSGLAQARVQFAGPVGAEDATVTPLRGTQPDAGRWQMLVAREPAWIAATATWVGGEPARGGLGQRLQQARDSVLGGAVPALLMAITTQPVRPISETELEAVQAELLRFLAAQPNLNAEVARLVGAR